MAVRSLNIAATGLNAQQTNVDVISQNLANMTTTGYKSQRAEFQDLIYQDLVRVGTNSSDQGTTLPVGVQLGLGVQTAGISRNNNQGTVTQTSQPFDLAVQGKGFFQVEQPDGTIAYTRDGTFKLSEDGIIVNAQGLTVQPAITVPDDAVDVSINLSGEVAVTLSGVVDPQILGQLEMATFINPGGLEAIGDNLFVETTASGPPILGNAGEDGVGGLLQGYVENSNVNPVSEVTSLIVAQRAYEMNTKVITASDQMLQTLNQSV
ncbi:MAG: flagellar basal-body rod protein FlgG [Rickettsiales bacterium]|jgi:flagellar basal-body rod protein FlgG|nr:flagellar basal-body rod protein FlgG [Rickettsiales bacterium]